MATTTLLLGDPSSFWQANGPGGWTLFIGDRDNYWGLSVRPYQANTSVTLEGGITSISDNLLNQVTDCTVTMNSLAGAGLLRFTAIKVSP